MKKAITVTSFCCAIVVSMTLTGCSPFASLVGAHEDGKSSETQDSGKKWTPSPRPEVTAKVSTPDEFMGSKTRLEEIMQALDEVDPNKLDTFLSENSTVSADGSEAYLANAEALVPELKWVQGDNENDVIGTITRVHATTALLTLARGNSLRFFVPHQAVKTREDGVVEVDLGLVPLTENPYQTIDEVTGIQQMHMTKIDGEWYLNADF